MKRLVTVNEKDRIVRCECKKFEYEGIPCMHLLTYFREFDFEMLPPEYVLRRWCVNAKKYSIFYKEIDQISKGKESLTMEIHNLKCLFNMIIREAISEESCNVAKKGLNEILDKMKKINVANGNIVSQMDKGKQVTSNAENESGNLVSFIRAPSIGSTTGSRSSKRLRSMRDKRQKKNRRCHGCGKSGQNHDKRNCPEL